MFVCVEISRQRPSTLKALVHRSGGGGSRYKRHGPPGASVKRDQGSPGTVPTPQFNEAKRLPITPDILLKLQKEWCQEKQGWSGTMLWAAASLCFFGFFRSGEITVPSEAGFDPGAHLSFSDIAVDSLENPQMLQVRLTASKTDPFRSGGKHLRQQDGRFSLPSGCSLKFHDIEERKCRPILQVPGWPPTNEGTVRVRGEAGAGRSEL